MQAITSLKDLVTFSLRNTLTLTIASGFLLFVNDDQAATLGLAQFRDDFRFWIGTIFLIFFSLSVSKIILRLGEYGIDQLEVWKGLQYSKRKLADLTSEERKILRGFLHSNTKTQTLGLESGVVQGLVAAGIIYRSSRIGRQWAGRGIGFDYNILDWVWIYLKKNPSLLDD